MEDLIKSYEGKLPGSILQEFKKEANERLLGTAAAVCTGILKGAHIVRVHDVKEMKEVAVMMDAIVNERSKRACHLSL